MTATVRLDDSLETRLNTLSEALHKKKSDVIRDAILFYANYMEDSKKSRIQGAVEKTKEVDAAEYKSMEGALFDGLQG